MHKLIWTPLPYTSQAALKPGTRAGRKNSLTAGAMCSAVVHVVVRCSMHNVVHT